MSQRKIGLELYHTAWQLVQHHFFNRERLVEIDWMSLEHRFDDRIYGVHTAKRILGKILPLLGDSYTHLIEPRKSAAKARTSTSDKEFIYTHRLRENIGYFGLDDFAHENTAEQIEEHLREIADCDAFVVDVRDNGGGLLSEMSAALGLFVKEAFLGYMDWQYSTGHHLRAMQMNEDESVVQITEDGSEATSELFHRMHALVAGKPMVVLINGATASAAEFFAAALRASVNDGSIVTMGTKSHGKGIGQVDYNLPGGLKMKISCLRFMSPTGVWFGDAAQTVNNGIEPDFVSTHSYNTVDAVTEGANYLRARLASLRNQSESQFLAERAEVIVAAA